MTHTELRLKQRHELKLLLVEAHRREDWPLARKLSVHWEKVKRKPRCEVCGVRLSRVTICGKGPNRFCRMHSPRRMSMKSSRFVACALLIFCVLAYAGPPRPNARFTAAPSTGYAPLTVTFTNQTSGNVQWYFLSFGDNGGVSMRPWSTFTHVYSEAGSFGATLTASNKNGFTIAEQTIVVTNRPTNAWVQLAWTRSTGTNVTAYRIYQGFSSFNYHSVFDFGDVTNGYISNLIHGTTYYFNATAIDKYGLESPFDGELSYTP